MMTSCKLVGDLVTTDGSWEVLITGDMVWR